MNFSLRHTIEWIAFFSATNKQCTYVRVSDNDLFPADTITRDSIIINRLSSSEMTSRIGPRRNGSKWTRISTSLSNCRAEPRWVSCLEIWRAFFLGIICEREPLAPQRRKHRTSTSYFFQEQWLPSFLRPHFTSPSAISYGKWIERRPSVLTTSVADRSG